MSAAIGAVAGAVFVVAFIVVATIVLVGRERRNEMRTLDAQLVTLADAFEMMERHIGEAMLPVMRQMATVLHDFAVAVGDAFNEKRIQ